MRGRFSKLLFTIIFSSFLIKAHASFEIFSDEFGFPNVGLNSSGNFLKDSWRDNLAADFIFSLDRVEKRPEKFRQEIEEIEEEESGISQAITEKKRPREDEVNEAPSPSAALTKNDIAEIRKFLRRKKNCPLTFKLLKTLTTMGACEYDLLREQVTDEEKKIYALCGTLRDRGLISSENLGIWSITAKGSYAFKLLQEEKEERHTFSHAHNKKNKTEDDLDPWRDENAYIKKCEKNLPLLRIFKNAERYSCDEIMSRLPEPHELDMDQLTIRIRNYMCHGLVGYNIKVSKYFITKKGLEILEEIKNDEINEFIDVYSIHSSIEENTNLLSSSEKQPHQTISRTKSLNDLEYEKDTSKMRQFVGRCATLQNRKNIQYAPESGKIIHTNSSSQMVPHEQKVETYPEEKPSGIFWEQLTDKIRENLLQKLDTMIIPSILGDTSLMQKIFVGNFLENLTHEINMIFFNQYGINIDHWLKNHIAERITISFSQSEK